jgi:hypothetical protein
MIFNMAIAWHDLGQTTGREMYLNKAGQLFDTVLSILDSTTRADLDTDSDDESCAILTCLVLNNRAQLYHAQCDYVHCEHCARSIRQLLFSTDMLEAYLDVEEVDEIRMNIVHLQPPTVAHAA